MEVFIHMINSSAAYFCLMIPWVAWVTPLISPNIIHRIASMWQIGWGLDSAGAVGQGTLILTAGSLSTLLSAWGALSNILRRKLLGAGEEL